MWGVYIKVLFKYIECEGEILRGGEKRRKVLYGFLVIVLGYIFCLVLGRGGDVKDI